MQESSSALVELVLRLVIPDECYIWLRAKNPLLVKLLSALLIWPALAWILAVFGSVFLIAEAFRDPSYFWQIMLLVILAVGAPVVVVIVVRKLLRRFWKPSAQMLADNDALVKKEIEEQKRRSAPYRAEKAARAALRKLKRPDWRCTYCGSWSPVKSIRCTCCDRLYRVKPEEE